MNDNWSDEAREQSHRDEQPTETLVNTTAACQHRPPIGLINLLNRHNPNHDSVGRTDHRCGLAALGGGAGGVAVYYAGSTGATSSESVQESPQLNRTERSHQPPKQPLPLRLPL